ncbi:pentapeptide repeat-containing protein [Nostoc commune]|uniref:pentapeptide repeat-containing protein n=1 Tax=Nostoc commune TaxID=1178 RepID=UPI000D597E96
MAFWNVDVFSSISVKKFSDKSNLAGGRAIAANLQQANLSYANLEQADLKDTNLDGAIFYNTIMPAGTIKNE